MSPPAFLVHFCAAFFVWNAGAASYYEEFVALRGTNILANQRIVASSLVDTNNTARKWGGALSEIKRAKELGEIAGVSPGMSMQDVVSRWGKPNYFWTRCYGGPRLVYRDVSVVFDPQSNRADKVRMEVFAHSESVDWQLSVERVIGSLGPPVQEIKDDNDRRVTLVYRAGGHRMEAYFPSRDMLMNVQLLRSPPVSKE